MNANKRKLKLVINTESFHYLVNLVLTEKHPGDVDEYSIAIQPVVICVYLRSFADCYI